MAQYFENPPKLAVIGDPIAHSKSPIIHHYWMEKYGIHSQLGAVGSYEKIQISADDLASRIDDLRAQNYLGCNVTVPHKQAIMDLCDELDAPAKAIGAVNTLKFADDGRIYGFNTDAYGFYHNIIQTQPDYAAANGPAMILGAGGAARAVLYALISHKCPQIYIANRTMDKAQALADEFGGANTTIHPIKWDDITTYLPNIHLLVNATSLGMAGMPPLSIGHNADIHDADVHDADIRNNINLAGLPNNALVNDLVYAPLMTDILIAAQSQSNPIVTGIGMLLHQAAQSFHHWFAITPSIDDVLIKKLF